MNSLLSIIKVTPREYYGEGHLPKPNDYCNLVDLGVYHTILAWEEDDNHYRQRILRGASNE